MAALDKSPTSIPTRSDPAEHAAIVTPSDTVDLTVVPKALVIGTSGDLKVITFGGETVVLPSIPVGILPLRVTRVYATLTTADKITAIW